MNTPILLLLFNRPEKTRQVFEQVRLQKPAYLYLAADGPRASIETDRALCLEARSIVNQIDWPCQVRTLFREYNLGCKQAVSGALDWFFEQEEMGIILEDDLVIDPSFFQFCTELLDKYKDEPQVATISGNNFQCGQIRGDASYYYSKFLQVWGWATWRRSWQLYRKDLIGIELPEMIEALKYYADDRNLFVRAMGDVFLNAKKHSQYAWRFPMAINNLDYCQIKQPLSKQESSSSWAYPFLFSLMWHSFKKNTKYLHIMPQVNLVQNIGFDQQSTHTKSFDGFLCVKTQSCDFPLRHSDKIYASSDADLFSEIHEHKMTAYYQWKRNFYTCYPRLANWFLQLKQCKNKMTSFSAR